MVNKTCKKCGQSKPRAEYHKDKKNEDGLYYACKACASIDQKQAYGNRRQAKLDQVRLGRYKLTQEQYDEMYERQGGVCAICQQPPANGRVLSIDHDHSCCPGLTSCGECVRGLLCTACNTALGKLKDDVVRLQRAIEYLSMSKYSL
jgi:hypothetical protein